jgi:hypothetical protein
MSNRCLDKGEPVFQRRFWLFIAGLAFSLGWPPSSAFY